MARKSWDPAKLARIDQQARGAVAQDAVQEERAETLRESRSFMPVDRIRPREVDTRPLSEEHVGALSQSIAALGLIEPLVVDRHGRLLAGGHRIEAIRRLETVDPEAYQRHFKDALVPVRVLDFDAEVDAELAWKIEVAENEKRRDYTPQEIQGLRERLLSLGFIEKEGRPKKGEEGKNLHPALAAVIGKNIRTVRRLLRDVPYEARRSRADKSRDLAGQLVKSLEKYQAGWKALSKKPKGFEEVNETASKLRELLLEALREKGN